MGDLYVASRSVDRLPPTTLLITAAAEEEEEEEDRSEDRTFLSPKWEIRRVCLARGSAIPQPEMDSISLII